MIWLRCIGGYTQLDPEALSDDGRRAADIGAGQDATFCGRPLRGMPAGFTPLDDLCLQQPEPGEPRDGVHGSGGASQ